MLIISTRAVAEIIQAVSAASIFGAGAAGAGACASTGVTISAATAAANPARIQRATASFVMLTPLSFLERVVVGFAGADAHGAVNIADKNFAVADLTGLRSGDDRLHDLVLLVVGDGDLDLQLGQEVHGVFGAAIDFGVTLLPSVALDLGHGHAVHPERGQRIADFI